MTGSDSRYETGLQTRREVLGREYVDRALESATEFTEPIQQLVTEYCWGAVWSRDGIDRKTRSLLNLGMLTALNRPHELAAHVRGAVNNGVQRGRDPRGAAASGDLLRPACRSRCVQDRRTSARRGPRRVEPSQRLIV